MKQIKRIVAVCLVVSMLIVAVSTINVLAYDATRDDVELVRNALNVAKSSDPQERSKYAMFEYSESFREKFEYMTNPIIDSINVTGKSLKEVSKSHEEKFGINAGFDLSVPSQVGIVSSSISGSFDMSESTNLSSISDEYFEYLNYYKYSKIVTTDWRSFDASQYFSSNFKRELLAVNDLSSAENLINKYGSHVFDQYYVGGVLHVTKYVASSTNISQEYSNRNYTLGLKTQFSTAMAADVNSAASQFSNNSLNTSSTKTTTSVSAWGGINFDALTAEGLFTYNQEYATQGGSGYVYKAWLRSIDDGNGVQVVKVENPVAIWELIENSQYHNEQLESLLKMAYTSILYRNYSENLMALDGANPLIDYASYTINGSERFAHAENGYIDIPEGTTVSFTMNSVLNNFIDDISLSVISGKQYCSLNNDVLSINNNTKGRIIELGVNLFEKKIISIKVHIQEKPVENKFSGGDGTENYPYIIANTEDWKAFISNGSYFDKYFKLISDIDFHGEVLTVGGESAKRTFSGNLNGNGHTIKNYSIISKNADFWETIGTIGVNKGTIENITLENVRCMNTGYIYSSGDANICAGILVGSNLGIIRNVQIKNSAIRITANLTSSKAKLNVGCIAGHNSGTIEFIEITDNYVMGQYTQKSQSSKGEICVGGLVGVMTNGNLNNNFVRGSNLNVRKATDSNANNTFLGGLIGKVDKGAISFGMTYKNVLSEDTTSKVGYVAGENSKGVFLNCFYESNDEKSIDSKAASGCTRYTKLSLSEINNRDVYVNWTNEIISGVYYGYPILKKK